MADTEETAHPTARSTDLRIAIVPFQELGIFSSSNCDDNDSRSKTEPCGIELMHINIHSYIAIAHCILGK